MRLIVALSRWCRYRLIRLLVGNMPVVMNMCYFRPVGFRGDLYTFPRKDLPGLFTGNELQSGKVYARALMIPTRDVLRRAPDEHARAG